MRLVTASMFAAALAIVSIGVVMTAPVDAEPFALGAKVCKECHIAEYEVWENTPHFKSFRKIHKSDKAKAIVKAVGGNKNMKRNETCVQCHYTLEGEKARAKSGPSCESCHGLASEWKDIHNDYGGAGVKREDEDEGHRAERYTAASASGMIWPSQKYDIAMNCMTCHGLAHPGVSGEPLSVMLDAGHPLKTEFELVRYSQGVVRHRFYPPNVLENAPMSDSELAQLFVEGQAAKLVSATAALVKSENENYRAAQQQRIADAVTALGNLSFGEAANLIDDPSDVNARALVEVISGQDLSGEVGDLLPSKDSYK